MKKVVFLLILLSLEVNSFASDQKYVPPIGIPAPSFGINETYRMYDYEPNQNPDLTYHDSASGGKYTHYVDASHSSSTDDGNPFGSEAKPRRTIPHSDNAPPAGSIVEIHNSFLQNGYGECCISGVGTADMPIFIRGIGMPRTEGPMSLGYYGNAKYLIVEGLSFPVLQIVGRSNSETFENSYISIRNCDFTAKLVPDGLGIKGIISTWTSNSVSNIVIYNNTFHDQGQWDPALAEGDNDYHGVGCYTGHHIWFLDNTFYHLEGDGVQVGGTTWGVHHVYVGGNTAHHNKQSGFWSKTASDVIFSQNTVYGIRPSSSSNGPGMGFQYDPNNVWFLFNKIYDCKNGMIVASSNNFPATRDGSYFIGNLIFDCSNDGMQFNELSPVSGTAKIMYNTIYKCPNGISNGYYQCSLSIFNNVISQYTHATKFADEYGTANHSDFDYNLIDGSGDLIWSSTYASLGALVAGTNHGDNCVEDNPGFVDPEKFDFNLQETSPVKDLQTSEQVQIVFNRFLQLYGIDLAADIDGIPRTAPTVVLPEPEDTSDSDDSGADVNTDTGSNDTGTVITETPSVPAVETGSSNTTGTTGSVSTPKISPLPMPLADTSTAETSSSNNVSTAEFSTIDPLYNAINSGLHVDNSKAAKVRTIKVRRIFERYDDIYCPPNKNSKSSVSYE